MAEHLNLLEPSSGLSDDESSEGSVDFTDRSTLVSETHEIRNIANGAHVISSRPSPTSRIPYDPSSARENRPAAPQSLYGYFPIRYVPFSEPSSSKVAKRSVSALDSDAVESESADPRSSSQQGLKGSSDNGRNDQQETKKRRRSSTTVSVVVRLEQFPGQSFSEVDGDLYCECCKAFLANDKSSIKKYEVSQSMLYSLCCRHLGLVKAKSTSSNLGNQHKSKLTKFQERFHEDQSFVSQILAMPWPKHEGTTLDPASKLLRVKALSIALSHGRPLALVDEFRELIEGNGNRGTLTTSKHLGQLIPLFGKSLDSNLAALKLYSVGIIFDGLSKDGEWVSVLLRGVEIGESMVLKQVLLAMVHNDTPYDHAVLNGILIPAIAKVGHLGNDCVRFFIHDDASVNSKSTNFLIGGLFTSAFDLKCMCHILDRVGSHILCPLMDEFCSLWQSIFKNSSKRINLFRKLAKAKFPSYNQIKVPS